MSWKKILKQKALEDVSAADMAKERTPAVPMPRHKGDISKVTLKSILKAPRVWRKYYEDG